ncbi:unnamed protein product [Ilex paraguariensis]|uniref:BZIP domain-containing protein n=1 Tax=Ilex paraguariensis TaxID=185542 RepID=A0ABC8U5Z6_9AQUA
MGGHGESIQKVNVTTHVQNVNVTTHVGGCGSSSASSGGAMPGSFIKSTNPSSNGGSSSSADSRGGVKVGCFTKYWYCVHSSNGMKIWRQVGVNVMADKPTQRRKRKYRGVYETEAEGAASLERLRIKRREAAAWVLEKKQAHKAQLLEQLQSLRAENEFLKKLHNFLEDNQMIDFPPKPLKRTMSGPI